MHVAAHSKMQCAPTPPRIAFFSRGKSLYDGVFSAPEPTDLMTPKDPLPASDASDIDRSWGGRRMTFWRGLMYRLSVPLGKLLLEVLWRTSRLRVVGEAGLIDAVARHGRVIPVCWHQHLLFCARYTVAGRVSGMKPGFLISPSVDGQAPTLLAQAYGAQVIRGSSTHTGTRAIRYLCSALKKGQLSTLITPDGPRGPRFEFKAGALLVAQLTDTPIVPLAYAARPAKLFRTWDKFVMPAPFARVVIAIGEPVRVPRDADEAQREQLRLEMQQRMLQTYQAAKAALNAS